MVGVRAAIQGVAQHGRNMIQPVLLGTHAARRRLITPKVSLFRSQYHSQDKIKGVPKGLRVPYTTVYITPLWADFHARYLHSRKSAGAK